MPDIQKILLLAAACAVFLITAATSALGSPQGETRRLSVDSAGVEGNCGPSYSLPAVAPSPQGRYAAFESCAALDPADTNSFVDVFVRDRFLNTTTLESLSTSGLSGDGYSAAPAITADARYVAFHSDATNLVGAGVDTNGALDVFVRDRQLQVTIRASVNALGAEGDAASWWPAVSADGSTVAFYSWATNLDLTQVDTNGVSDAFVHDLATGITTRVSVNSNGTEGDAPSGPNNPWIWSEIALSADGRFVAFESEASNLDLVTPDANGVRDIFVHDRQNGTTARVNKSSLGAEADTMSWFPSIRGDGQAVVFASAASTLHPDATDFLCDVFLHDLSTGQTTLVSDAPEGDGWSEHPSISLDGGTVAYSSTSTSLVEGDTNGESDVFAYDVSSGTQSRISVSTTEEEADLSSFTPSVSSDGRVIAFTSDATNLVPMDGNGADDAFVRDRGFGTSYCGPAVPNSTGKPAVITIAGSDSVAHDSLTLVATDLPTHKSGYFLVSATSGFVANPGGSQGNLCLGGQIGRFRALVQSSGSTGSFSIETDLTDLPKHGAAMPGETLYFQAWYRDTNPDSTSNFTDGSWVTFQ